MDNYWILGKSVEIKVSSKMAGYKMNLPFNAELNIFSLILPTYFDIIVWCILFTHHTNKIIIYLYKEAYI